MTRKMVCSAIGAVLVSGLLSGASGPADEDDSVVLARDAIVKFADRRMLAVERPGILSEAVREGEQVASGQIVLRVRDAVPKSALSVAAARADSDADVRAAKKEQELAELEYHSHLKANESRPGTYTDIDIRRAQLAAESAALNVEQLEHERGVDQRLRQQAEDDLNTYYVPSTISGLVTHAFKGAGEAVQLGEPVLEVVSTQTARVVGFVALRDVRRVKVGMPVTARVWLDGLRSDPLTASGSAHEPPAILSIDGELGFVDVEVQEVAEVVRVWAEVPNQDGMLRDGLNAEIVIHVGDRSRSAGKSPRTSR